VEAFEDGVRRAERAAGPEAPPSPLIPAAETLPRPFAAATAATPASPPRPAGAGPNLSRRVPGATLRDPGAVPRPPLHLVDNRTADPDSARDLVEQFESGVLRALREARPEGSPQ
jgi:hypothetical protein